MDFYYLQLLIGFIGLTAIAIPFSSNIREINYRNIGVGILFQIVLGITTLLSGLNIFLASFHQIGSILLISFLKYSASAQIFSYW